MKSINQEVSSILNKHVAIQKCLKREIINVRALAKFLIESYHLNYPLDAIISAIRRFDLDEVSLIGSKKAEEIFSQVLITTKDNVARILLKEKSFQIVCEDFLNDKLLKENARIIKGKELLTLVVNQNDLDKKLSLFKKADLLEVHTTLSEIRLHFPKNVHNAKGLFARISGELAMRDINIEEIIYTFPDILIYVKEDNLVNAHKTLMEMKKKTLLNLVNSAIK